MRNPGLGRLAKFQNGKLTNDFAWQMLTGIPDGLQSFMYGHFDNDGKMTGDEVGKGASILSRCLMVSTNQADPSCFYFRIS